MNRLDQKINEHFSGLVVRKDLVKKVKGNAIVPTYVLEYLLGQYCATSDEASIQSGIETVKEVLRKHYVHRNEANLVKSVIREKGRHRVIDKISVELNDKTDTYEAVFSNLGIRQVLVDADTVTRHPKLLVSGVWCIAEISYRYTEDTRAIPWILDSLKPIQLSHFDFDQYLATRRQFTADEWIDLLMQSIGFNPEQFTPRGKLLQLMRLVPYCERNYNLIELGPKGTGKSHIYSDFSPHGILISGGEVTVPKLFVNNSTGRIGLVGYWDIVAFDEFAGRQKRPNKALVDILKNYMANKSFSRGIETLGAEASMVFVGNTRHDLQHMLMHSDLFEELPAAFYDSAFLDRLHFYIPGWEVEIIRGEMFSESYGFVVDYLAEILRNLRTYDFSHHYAEHFSLLSDISTRDRDGIQKTFSGLMKIIYPHGEATPDEIEHLLRFALEGRKRVKDQLMRIDTTYADVRFGYQPVNDVSIRLVQTREEQDYPQHYYQKSTQPTPPAADAFPAPLPAVPTPTRSLDDLIASGESGTLEFKSSLEWDIYQNKANQGLRREVLKTLVAFLNSDGGTLLIGVKDDGTVLGIENDLKLQKNSPDKFLNHLTSLITDLIGAEFSPHIKIRFDDVAGQQICLVEVQRASDPAYYKGDKGSEMYIRFGSTSRQLDVKEAFSYIRGRWG